MFVDDAGNPMSFNTFIERQTSGCAEGAGLRPTIGFATIQNIAGSTQVSVQSFLWRVQPAHRARLESQLRQWTPGRDSGARQDRYPRRIYADLRPYAGHPHGRHSRQRSRHRTGDAVRRIRPSPERAEGSGAPTPTTAFRIGTDGLTAPVLNLSPTLPQPYFPGVNGAAGAGDGALLDSNFRQDRSDEVNFTIQRRFPRKW